MPPSDEPDWALYHAALAGRVHLKALCEADQAFVVRRLTERGESAREIAERTHCGARLVQRIRGTM